MSSTHAPAAGPVSTSPEWDDNLLRNPHAVADKRKRVQKMFAAIAPSYDLNNRLHSLWMDQAWRRKAVKLAKLKPTDRVVDVACGTGDLALAFCRRLEDLNKDWSADRAVIGVDFTFQMLPIAFRKGQRFRDRYSHVFWDPGGSGSPELNYRWINGDAQSLPLPDACCDVVSIAFGIRNVQDTAKAIREFHRILRPGGRLIILEFSLPTNPVLRGLYNFYFRHILPRTATLISGDKTGAYKYLPESVNTYIGRETMTGMMKEAGLTEITTHAMTFGVCVCYRGVVT